MGKLGRRVSKIYHRMFGRNQSSKSGKGRDQGQRRYKTKKMEGRRDLWGQVRMNMQLLIMLVWLSSAPNHCSLTCTVMKTHSQLFPAWMHSLLWACMSEPYRKPRSAHWWVEEVCMPTTGTRSCKIEGLQVQVITTRGVWTSCCTNSI